MGDPLEALLVRQLRRAGITDNGEEAIAPPEEEAWQRLLRSLNEHYKSIEEDRSLLVRTSELAAAEVNDIRQQMLEQRDAMQTTIGSIAATVGVLSKITASAQDRETAQVLEDLESAKKEAIRRFDHILAEGEHPGRAALTGLKSHVAQLADVLGRMQERAAEGARIRRGLDEASAIQAVLLPSSEPIERPAAVVAGAARQAEGCGGDFWSVEDLANDRALILVGDATGHGLAAAIVSGVARAASYLAATELREKDSAAAASGVLRVMNQAIHAAAKREVMMTCSAGVLDPATRTLTLANAGHTFTYLVRGGIVRPLIVQGPHLGSAPSAEYDTISVSLQKDDLLVWFSDGVVEAESASGEQFTEKRLRALCQRLAKDGAVATRDGILQVLDEFRGGTPQGDDITIVSASVR